MAAAGELPQPAGAHPRPDVQIAFTGISPRRCRSAGSRQRLLRAAALISDPGGSEAGGHNQMFHSSNAAAQVPAGIRAGLVLAITMLGVVLELRVAPTNLAMLYL